MINHIDLGTVLRRTVCDLYSDLVTRPTGAAVRTGIEQQLADTEERTLTIIDFTHVGLLDYSCADEIVAKLLVSYCEPSGERGVSASVSRQSKRTRTLSALVSGSVRGQSGSATTRNAIRLSAPRKVWRGGRGRSSGTAAYAGPPTGSATWRC